MNGKKENHYEDFVETLRFLYNKKEKDLVGVEKQLAVFRRLLESLPINSNSQTTVRDELSNNLLKVMCRTEKNLTTDDRNSMLVECNPESKVNKFDLKHAEIIDNIANILECRDQIEYWKTIPYLLNFMKKLL